MKADALTCSTNACDVTRGETAAAKRSATPNFGSLARAYRWMEWFSFGPFLWWCRCAFLSEMRDQRRALVIGDGDGRFTARLLAENNKVHVDAVDASSAMLRAMLRELTRGAASHAARVLPICADARAWRTVQGSFAASQYDLVVTHFFLDCLDTDEVRALAERLRDAVEPRAVWVVSEFAVPRGLFGRLIARPLVWALYLAFSLLTGLQQRRLPDHRCALREAGFALEKEKSWLGGLLVSQLWTIG